MKKSIFILLAVILLVFPFACSRASEENSAIDQGGLLAPGAAPSPTITTPSFSSYSDKGTGSVPASEPAPYSPDENYDSAYSTATSVPMIVRTANMELVVEDVALTIDEISNLADTFDGYVVTSRNWHVGERLVGNISIRVAVDYFDEAILALRGLAVEVNSET
ncbi:MAG: DUF4349 domain-containing protein, partial [Dehalococcoidales bacterium]